MPRTDAAALEERAHAGDGESVARPGLVDGVVERPQLAVEGQRQQRVATFASHLRLQQPRCPFERCHRFPPCSPAEHCEPRLPLRQQASGATIGGWPTARGTGKQDGFETVVF